MLWVPEHHLWVGSRPKPCVIEWPRGRSNLGTSVALIALRFQCRPCWRTRAFRVCPGWSPRATGSAPPACRKETTRTAWEPSSARWTPSTRSCATRAWTPRSSCRCSDSFSTWSARWRSTTCFCGRTSAPGAQACSSGGSARLSPPRGQGAPRTPAPHTRATLVPENDTQIQVAVLVTGSVWLGPISFLFVDEIHHIPRRWAS